MSKNKIILSALLTLLAIVVYAFFSISTQSLETRDSQTYEEPSANKKKECISAYRVRYRVGDVSTFSNHRSPIEAVVTGTLMARFWSEGERRFALFKPVSIELSGNSDELVKTMYEQPFIAELTSEGLFNNFYFPNNVVKEDEMPLKGFILPLQMAVNANKQNYQTDENDTTGTYVSEYVKIGNNLKKTKLYYTDLLSSTSDQPLTGTFKTSEATGVLSQDGCWFEEITGKDRVEISAGKAQSLVLGSTLQYSLKRVESPYLSKFSDSYANKSFQYILNLFKSAPKRKTSVIKQLGVKNKKIALIERNITIESILEAMNDTNGINELSIFYLQENPEALKKITRLILQNEIDDNKIMHLVELFAHVGTPVAQKSLINIMESTDVSYDSRLRSAVAFSSLVAEPTPETIDSLFAYSDQLSTREDAELSSSVMLALGAISHSGADGNTQASERISKKLIEKLNQANYPSQERTLLLSAGNALLNNSEIPESLDIQRYLSSDDAPVRDAAITLLGQVDSKESIEILMNQQSLESDVTLKKKIYGVLSNKTLDINSLSIIKEKVFEEPDENVRYNMIKILGENKKIDGTIDETFEKLLKEETSKDNFKKILQYL